MSVARWLSIAGNATPTASGSISSPADGLVIATRLADADASGAVGDDARIIWLLARSMQEQCASSVVCGLGTPGHRERHDGGPSLEEEQNKRRAAIALLETWLADESGYDEAVWTRAKGAIEAHRLSARSRFRE